MNSKKSIPVLAVLFLVVLGFIWLVNPEIVSREEQDLSSFFEDGQKVRTPYAARIGFYPDDEYALKPLISNLLSQAYKEPLKGEIKAMIVPHAGYRYSGLVAAHAYCQLEGKSLRTVVLIGPSHRVPVQGAAIGDEDYYMTPLGNIPLDRELANEISKMGFGLNINSAPLQQEHSLEVQLPFLQTVLGDSFKIVPIVTGQTDLKFAEELGKILANLMKRDSLLVLISTDMSHYHPYENAFLMDSATLDEIQKKNPESLYESISAGQCELCGSDGVIALLYAARQLNLAPEILKYMNSGDVTGEKKEVVGYTSIAFTGAEAPTPKADKTVSLEDEKKALQLARQTLESYLDNAVIPDFGDQGAGLNQSRGAFVTLKKGGKLRGCIGHIAADTPLLKLLPKMAVASAVQDPRFEPVTLAELKACRIEISILSQPVKVNDVNEIVIGRDGLIIKKGYSSGLLLPQVPVEWGWDRGTFLEQLCNKAGLPAGSWKDAELYRFTAQVFSE